jgi:hypothetical protein
LPELRRNEAEFKSINYCKFYLFEGADKNSHCSHLSDADNTKHSDLSGVYNGNKRALPSGQDDQSGFCFLRIAQIV